MLGAICDEHGGFDNGFIKNWKRGSLFLHTFSATRKSMSQASRRRAENLILVNYRSLLVAFPTNQIVRM